MIGFRINGRLGNQLFQVAAAYALARHKGYSLHLLPDERSGKFIVPDYFEIPLQWAPGWKWMRSIPEWFPRRIQVRIRRVVNTLYYSRQNLPIQKSEDPMVLDRAFFQIQDGVILDGYFQSEYYFKDYQSEIRQLFTVQQRYQQLWKQWYHHLPNHEKLVAVHVRLGDYKNQPGWNTGSADVTLPRQYYDSLMDREAGSGKLMVILSDEPDTVADWFGHRPDTFISRESMILDLITLMHAHSCILSHSSFSWWGAWLNNRPDKQIYVPRNFLGFRTGRMTPEGIIPENWISIEVPYEN